MFRGEKIGRKFTGRVTETRSEVIERTGSRGGNDYAARGSTAIMREIEARNAEGLRLILCEECAGYEVYPSSLAAAFEEERFTNAPFFRTKSM
jgi:hypothetical protein